MEAAKRDQGSLLRKNRDRGNAIHIVSKTHGMERPFVKGFQSPPRCSSCGPCAPLKPKHV